jgi:hypothetical protein
MFRDQDQLTFREQLTGVLTAAYSMAGVAKLVAKSDIGFAISLIEQNRRQLHQRLASIGKATSLPDSDILMVAASAAIDAAIDEAIASISQPTAD